MRATSLLRTILALESTRVLGLELDGMGLVVDVAPTWRKPRCSGCGKRRAGYDAPDRAASWRHLDFAGMQVVLRYVTDQRVASSAEVVVVVGDRAAVSNSKA